MGIELAFLFFLIGVLLGSMVFFAAVVAPVVFKSLEASQAGIYLRAVFPVYYAWGIIMATVIVISSYFIDHTILLIAAVITVLFIYTRQVLMPMINNARDARLSGGEKEHALFKRLHFFSVLINLSQILLLAASLVLLMQRL